MADENTSSNNLRLHISELPEKWSEPLKQFFIKQPDFNDEVSAALSGQLQINAKLNQQLQQLEQRVRKVEGK